MKTLILKGMSVLIAISLGAMFILFGVSEAATADVASSFVIHVKGGNKFLYEAPPQVVTPGKVLSGESIPVLPGGPNQTPLTNHASFYLPAWLLKLEGIKFGQIASISMEGEGVQAILVHPNCVVAQKPVAFQNSSPPGCHILKLNDPADATLEGVYVHFRALAGTKNGLHKLTVELKPGALSAAGQRTIIYSIYVAHSAKAKLTEAYYVKEGAKGDFGKLLNAPKLYTKEERADALNRLSLPDSHSLSILDTSVKEPITIENLSNGKPLIGEMDNAPLAAPLVELIFSGNGAGSLKFAAPECLQVSDQKNINANTLRVRVQFKVPSGTLVPPSGFVSHLSDIPSAACQWFLYDPLLDSQINQSPIHDGTSLNNFTVLDSPGSTVRIRPRFLTIAGMGDSYAAGEGAPESFNEKAKRATWESVQCHRSSNSSLTQGAKNITEIPGIWVLYQNFACSGATIFNGLIGFYAGIPLPFGQQQPLPERPQVDQVKTWLSVQGVTELDALLLNIGGNDIGFGQVIGNCVSPWLLVRDCASHPPLQQTLHRGAQGITGVVGFNNLQAAYDILDEYLAKLSPKAVFITEAPDPTRIGGPLNAVGAELLAQLCNSTELFDDGYALLPTDITWGDLTPDHPVLKYLEEGAKIGNLTFNEVVWIFRDVVQPLNKAIAEAANRHNWQFISGFVEHSYDHGFCLKERYINTFQDSKEDLQGDPFGAVHPTKEAYDIYGDIVARKLIMFFGLPDRPTIRSIEDTHSQQITRHQLGDTSDTPLDPGDNFPFGTTRDPEDPDLKIPIAAALTRFRVQIAPTTRSLHVTFEFIRQNRFSGTQIGELGTIDADKVGGFQSRLEYTVMRTLNLCERLKYRWRIQHSGTDGTKNYTTKWRVVMPTSLANHEEIDLCHS